MKLHFCTLFNSAYLSRGLAMYQSLQQQCKDFHLYVFAFDQLCYDHLASLKLEHLTVISLSEFEDPELLRVKKERTAAEYCWTCSASTIHYCISRFGLSNCTYIDADMIFYSDPVVLFNEMGQNSVLITSHRYTAEYDQSATSGKYCVQFVTFKNDEAGMKVLNWWKDACIEWCYDRVEDGKFGDQKYLDEFAVRFSGVHELEHLGGGIAPWNVQQYTFTEQNGKLIGKEIRSQRSFDVVFFHYHGLKFYDDGIVSFSHSAYDLSQQVQQMFYVPYVKTLNALKQSITGFNANGSAGKSPLSPLTLFLILRFYLAGVRKSIGNIFGKGLKKRLQHHYFYYTNEL